jgi:hypothetical protein
VRCVAVDWSGRVTGAQRFIWIAEAVDGRLTVLEDGRDREEAIDWVIARAATYPELVAGFDFAFSFPAWYCQTRGWRDGPSVWRAMAAEGEALLATCPDPFWGRPGHGRPGSVQRGLRETDRVDIRGAKSVFQIGGSGAVGTGSVRGMPQLLALRAAGFAVWPFDPPRLPLAIEIYPRAMYGRAVVKSRGSDRRRALDQRLAGQPAELLTRAAASEDAFDAAVSAFVMSRSEAALRALSFDQAWTLEGRAWTPPPGVVTEPRTRRVPPRRARESRTL